MNSIEENGNILAQQFTYLGLKCKFVSTIKTPQFCVYCFNCDNIADYSKKYVLFLLEKIVAYNHIKCSFYEQNVSHFAIATEWAKRPMFKLSSISIGAIGIDNEGNEFAFDWDKTSHILVGGTTGSGKSCFLSSLLVSISLNEKSIGSLYIIDPKRYSYNEWKQYQFAHLITEMDEVNNTLAGLVEIMEQRYRELEIDPNKKFTKIYVVIDELADLMLQTKYDCETNITLLVQKSRAVSIHLILATQRPTADVINGLIKANCDTRVCFRTASVRDSVVLLGHKGGEELVGNGDCIIKQGGKETRCQIAYVSKEGTKVYVDFLRKKIEEVKQKFNI